MAEERRRDERVRLPLEMRWQGISGKHKARIYDVSLGGCYIESLGQVTLGERVRFEMQLPAGNWIPFQGGVVHWQPNLGFGVHFVYLTEIQRRALAELIDQAHGGRTQIDQTSSAA
jgi:hypothetical protein